LDITSPIILTHHSHIRRLGTSTPYSGKAAKTVHGWCSECPYFVRNMEHKKCFEQRREESSIDVAIRLHTKCERIPQNSSENPYRRDSVYPFHITFYEIIDRQDNKLTSEQMKDEGLLFPQDSRDYDEANMFRRSAFTVSLINR